MIRKTICFALMAIALVAAAVQIRLVAQEAGESSTPAGQPRVTTATAAEFAERLAEGDQLVTQLQAALRSQPGALVLRDRAGRYEAEAREEARVNGVEKLVEELFKPAGEWLALRDGQEGFREEFLRTSATFTLDIGAMKKALREKAAKLELETDTDKLVHRFMTHDSAPVILYARELRPRMRPGVQVLERVFDHLFALRRDGRFVIRLDTRPQAKEMAEQLAGQADFLPRVKRDIAEFSEEIAVIDPFHERLKKSFNDPLFVAGLLVEMFEGKRPNRGQAERLMEQLEEIFREAGDGLVLRSEEREEVEEFIRERERVRDAAEAIREPLADFTDKVAVDDELHQAWIEILRSDVGLVRIAGEIDYGTASVSDAVDQFFGNILVEKDNGKLHVQPTEFDEDELIEGLTGVFRQARAARRRGRELDKLVAKVSDAELRAALQSMGGKLAFQERLEARVAHDVPDGFERWIAEHFEETASGFVIREEAREEIEEVIHQVAEVAEELENADF